MPRKVFRDSDGSEDELDSDNEESHPLEEKDEDQAVSLDSDSDSAPDDVGFNDGKLTALQKVKETMKQIEKDKQRKKLKRREHDTIYKEQKKKKLEALAQSRLSEEILDEISHQPKVQKAGPPRQPEETEVSGDETNQEEHLEEEADTLGQEANFISLDSRVQAVYVKEVKPKSSIEKAIAFRHNQLYGPKVKRVPAREKFAKRKKKKAQFS